MKSGFEMRHDELKVAIRVGLYRNHKSMCCGMAAEMSLQSRAGKGVIRAKRKHKGRAAAYFIASEMHRKGEPGWYVGNVFLDARHLGCGEPEHEFLHCVLEIAEWLREKGKVRAKRVKGHRLTTMWWNEWICDCHSNVIRVWRLWLKYGKDADKIPGRLVPRDIFPVDI